MYDSLYIISLYYLINRTILFSSEKTNGWRKTGKGFRYIFATREKIAETIEDQVFPRRRKTSSIMCCTAHAHTYTYTHIRDGKIARRMVSLFSSFSLPLFPPILFTRPDARFLQYPPRAVASLFAASSRRCSHPKASSVSTPGEISSFFRPRLLSPLSCNKNIARFSLEHNVSTTPIN